MPTISLLTRFFKTLLKDFWETMKESRFDKALLFATVLYVLVHKVKGWELLTTAVLAVCGVLMIHAVVAAHSVVAEIREQQNKPTKKRLIVTGTGEDIYLAAPVVPKWYVAKLCMITLVVWGVCVYTAWKAWEEGEMIAANAEKPDIRILDFQHLITPAWQARHQLSVINASAFTAERVNWDSRIKLIAVPDGGTVDPTFPLAVDAEREIFKEEADQDTWMRDMSDQTSITPGERIELSDMHGPYVSPKDLVDMKDGKLLFFIGGRIKYTNSSGCIFETDFCGYWQRNWNLQYQCGGPHSFEAVRTKDKCLGKK